MALKIPSAFLVTRVVRPGSMDGPVESSDGLLLSRSGGHRESGELIQLLVRLRMSDRETRT